MARPKKVPERTLESKLRRRSLREKDPVVREQIETRSNEVKKLQSFAPNDMEATKLVRGLFASKGFSAVEELLNMAMNPPDDLQSKDRVMILKFLAEFEAPKAKAVDMARLGEQNAGINIQVVNFQGTSKKELSGEKKYTDADYKEFGGEARAPQDR